MMELITIAAAQAIAKIALDKPQGRYTEAEPLSVRLFSILEKVLPLNHPSLAIVRGNLVELRSKLK